MKWKKTPSKKSSIKITAISLSLQKNLELQELHFTAGYINMAYKKFKYPLVFRILSIVFCIALLLFTSQLQNKYYLFGAICLTAILFLNLFYFVNNRFAEMDDFLESVKYRDFSRF